MVSQIIIDLAKQGIHLYLDQNGLGFKAKKGAMTPERKQLIVQNKAEIMAFLQQQSQADDDNTVEIKPRDPNLETMPLSYMQRRLWMQSQLDSGSSQYNINAALNLSGNLNVSVLIDCFSSIVARHESLRTNFVVDKNGEPRQVVAPATAMDCDLLDLTHIAASARADKVRQVISESALKSFDLSRDCKLRVQLLKLQETEYVLSVNMHHIASDQWSINILVQEFCALYLAQTGQTPNEQAPLPPLSIQYGDYSVWQHQEWPQEVLQQQTQYWQKQLKDLPMVHSLPLDKPRPPRPSFGGNTVTATIDKGAFGRLKQFCLANGATVFMGLHAVFAALVARYSNERDVVIGIPVANRNNKQTTELIGFFVNTLVLRSDLSQSLSFTQLLQQSKTVLLEAYEHQQVPFESVVDAVQPQRTTSHNALFQLELIFHGSDEQAISLPDLSISPYEQESDQAKFDLSLHVKDEGAEAVIGWTYNTDIFEPSFIEGMCDSFLVLLNSLLEQPESDVFKVNMLADKAKRQVVLEFNDNQQAVSEHQFVHQMFEASAQHHPNVVALSYKGVELTYQQLEARANQLAQVLIEHGVSANDQVAIYLERGVDMVLSVLAVLKAGAGYIPLDPTLPKGRLNSIFDDLPAGIIITQHSLAANAQPIAREMLVMDQQDCLTRLDAAPKSKPVVTELQSSHLAYVLYTSGTTGKPKGIAMPHAPLVNLMAAMPVRSPELQGRLNTILYSSIGFDMSFTDMFLAFNSGGTLHVIDKQDQLDIELLMTLVEKQQVNVLNLPFAMTQTLCEVCNSEKRSLHNLKAVISTAEPLKITPAIRECFVRHNHCRLINQYGPSETHVVTSISLPEDVARWPELPGIGPAIANTQCYVLDDNLQPVPRGVVGELYIGGVCLSRGYVNNPELTAQRFVDHPFETGSQLYRTGDWVRYCADGDIAYVGREDNLVKLRGFRIELGEIEHQLTQHQRVNNALVLLNEQGGEQSTEQHTEKSTERTTDKNIVAYVCAQQETPASVSQLVSELKGLIRANLPNYMMPSQFVVLDTFPMTPNAKVDRVALLAKAGTLSGEERAVQEQSDSALQSQLAEIWCEVLNRSNVGLNEHFFEVGGNSLSLIKVQRKIKELTAYDVSMTDLFTYTTIAELAAWLSNAEQTSFGGAAGSQTTDSADNIANRATNNKPGNKDIAVIGMACRFPDAETPEAFWQNLTEGKESLQYFTDDELLASGLAASDIQRDDYLKSGFVLPNIEYFDAEFFGFTPREAQVMDPQQRVMFECVNDVLEHAGYAQGSRGNNTGIFVGVSDSRYMFDNLLSRQDILENVGVMGIQLGNVKDFMATRLANKFNLTGPAININTACSTSLVAVHQACQSLLEGDCQTAIAGGASISLLKPVGRIPEEGGIMSADGHCRAFDASAAGTRAGSGAGVLLLKPLDKALADGDNIHAVIKGSAINNDGADKVGYTAPSVQGQSRVISAALQKAQVTPDSISYVEAHGTGTKLGDPIEMEALRRAFSGVKEKQFCAMGAVKASIGHLESAAGVAGLIKTINMLKHKKLVPSVNYHNPNPHIEFENSPFYVNTEFKDWNHNGTPLRAGVSSFGIGGTNAHVILEEAPVAANAKKAETEAALNTINKHAKNQLLLVSGKSEQALTANIQRLAGWLEDQPQDSQQTDSQQESQQSQVGLQDVAFSLATGRVAHEWRTSVVANDISTLSAQLNEADSKGFTRADNTSAVFMFPGQGSQYKSMAQGLYHNEPRFKSTLDRCAAVLQRHLGMNICDALYREDVEVDLNQTRISQPVMFAIEYAIADLLMHWNIKPDAMIGHSLGEYVAACIAGVFTLSDALSLVAKRGELMQNMAPGTMISVAMGETELLPLLQQHQCDLAAVNGRMSCVASGSVQAIAELKKAVQEYGSDAVELTTSHAFHSHMMDDTLQAFADVVSGTTRNAPTTPFVSNLTGEFISDEQATDAQYWVAHLRNTVRFNQGLQALNQLKDPVFIEVGPGKTLSSFLKRSMAASGAQNSPLRSVTSIRHINDKVCDHHYFLKAVGELWEQGIKVKWPTQDADKRGKVLLLPAYAYQREHHWLESGADILGAAPYPQKLSGSDVKDWFYKPVWQLRTPNGVVHQATSQWDANADYQWLIVAKDDPDSQLICEALRQHQQSVRLTQEPLAALEHCNGALKILYLAPLNYLDPDRASGVEGANHLGELMQALMGYSHPVEFNLVTADSFQITGSEFIKPLQSLFHGFVKVAGQENGDIKCHHIDIDVTDGLNKSSLNGLLSHLQETKRPVEVAIRSGMQFAREFVSSDQLLNANTPIALRQQGHYLITGGAGKVALILADWLCSRYKTNVTLVTRRSHTDMLVSNPELAAKIKAMEASGARVQLVQGDVSEASSMQAAVGLAEQAFGSVHGVIHSAAAPQVSVAIQDYSRDFLMKQLKPKLDGVDVLHGIFQNKDTDFLVMMSSLSTVLGGLGFASYVSANSYLDSFTHQRHAEGDHRWLAINWDGWNVFEPEQLEGLMHEHGTMSPEEGCQAFEHALSLGFQPQLVQAKVDLQARLCKWVHQLDLVSSQDHNSSTESADKQYAQRRHSSSYQAPETDMEKHLVDIWQQLLGIEPIGVNDNFFELGGDSLLATRVLTLLKKQVELENTAFTIRDFFEHPVISELAEKLSVNTASTPTETVESVEEVKARLQASNKVVEEGEF